MRDPMKGLEQIITEAQQEGKFEDLPGKGKPLVLDPSPDAVVKGILKQANVSMAPEWIKLACEIDRLLEQGQELLREYAAVAAADQERLLHAVAGPSPEAERPSASSRSGWRAIITSISPARSPAPVQTMRRDEALAEAQRRWDTTLEQYAALLHAVNRAIRRFNPIVPMDNRQRALLPVRERLEAFVERFPRLARGEDGGIRAERGHVPASLLTPPEPVDSERLKRDVLQTAALLGLRQGGRKPPPIG